jgi:hypothetical protein
MRTGILAALAAVGLSCSSSGGDAVKPLTLPFGPYELQPYQEITDECVQISLNNKDDLYLNAVDLATGVGFHHSNWFWLPQNDITGSDGTFVCADRDFSEVTAAIYGGVITAQSTQAPDTLQQFPEGAAVRIPAGSRIVGQLHLLNPGEAPLHITPHITLTPIPKSDVTVQLAAMSFENMSIALPPNAQSSFTLDCDLGSASQNATGGPPDFKMYYALAHYHALGTGMQIEAVMADDVTSTTIFQTTDTIGTPLGETLDPLFDFTGYSRIRYTCDYYNNSANTVYWGEGSAEMCIMLAFTDSAFEFGGGVVADDAPGSATDVNNVMQYNHACTTVYATALSQ